MARYISQIVRSILNGDSGKNACVLLVSSMSNLKSLLKSRSTHVEHMSLTQYRILSFQKANWNFPFVEISPMIIENKGLPSPSLPFRLNKQELTEIKKNLKFSSISSLQMKRT